MNIDLVNSLIKNFFIILFTNIIIVKLLNLKKPSKKIKFQICIFSIISTVIFVGVKYYVDSIVALIILCIMLEFFIEKSIRNNKNLTIVTILIALSICFVSFGMATRVSFSIWQIFKINNKYMQLFNIIILQWILIYFFFKVKRFKKGFYFLQNNIKNQYIEIIIVNISIIIIFIYGISGNYSGDELTKHIFTILIVLAILMIITIQKILIMYYKQKLLDQTVKDYKNDIQQKEKIIKDLREENLKFSKINHEFYNRQKALETKVMEITNFKTEYSAEIGIIDRINNLSKEYSMKMEETKKPNKLPKTDISEIDDMLNYMQKECEKYGIEFNVQINANMYHMINHLIEKSKLETLLGDHIRDAIIAINSSNNKNKRILVIIGIVEKCFEIGFYDTGIEFEIETLLKLGLEPITTHKETGGSGIGFMTTFETLKETNASLIIEEKKPLNDVDYTKAVIIRFDEKSEYRIKSYRKEEIVNRNTDKRIKIL